MSDQASLRYRPRTLDDLVGVDNLVSRLRRRYAKSTPRVVMLVGETGSGKTTIARILAASLQCRHQKVFGNPCKKCYKRRADFDVIEINCGDVSGTKEEFRKATEGYTFAPKPGSKHRVFIVDEAQGLSSGAQTLMLKLLEDGPKTTKWFLCTTAPHKLLDTIVGRSKLYDVPSLDLEGVRKLVAVLLKKMHSHLDPEPLVDAILEAGVTSCRKVVHAVENYACGDSIEDSVQVDVATNVDAFAVVRSVTKGDWEGCAKLMKDARPEDARGVILMASKYLKSILLDETEFSARATNVSKAMEKLTLLAGMEDSLRLAGVVAVLFQLSKSFKEYKR